MADNLTTQTTVATLPSGSVIATDDVGGVQYQRVKLSLGADGTAADAPVGGGTEAGVLRVTIASNSTGVVAISQPGLAGGILQSVTTVGAVAVALPATPLAGRATMLVQNVGATTIYLGKSTVTADTAATGGIQLLAGQSIPISLAAAVVLYAISSAAGGLVACLEVSA